MAIDQRLKAWLRGRTRCSAKRNRFCDLPPSVDGDADCAFEYCPIQRAIVDEGRDMARTATEKGG